ncbi:hypothetical protein [Spiroplasma endosymbiont of Polydrusus cervinus]|uniref:hypothetical protein n=1 Tax=Spiroplasma endosymbiont of Polydrusus cervinus TaxID=3066287 RepID=UPI0030D15740
MTIFNNLNLKIVQTYPNYYHKLEDKSLEHVVEQDQFTLTYIDLEKINKLINTSAVGVQSSKKELTFTVNQYIIYKRILWKVRLIINGIKRKRIWALR